MSHVSAIDLHGMRTSQARSLVSFIAPHFLSTVKRPSVSIPAASWLYVNYKRRATVSRPPPMAGISMATEARLEETVSAAAADPKGQYVVVRRDLMDTWPTGSVIAQAVHASVAAVWENRSESVTSAYCAQDGNRHALQAPDGDGTASTQMHTVVLEAKNEAAVLKLAEKLTDNDIKFVMWREQPENFVTALAAKPYPRSEVKKLFSKFKLFK